MNAAEIIARKRDGLKLADDEIEFFLRGFTNGSIPDYQMAALAMAVFCRGMEAAETAKLTDVMLRSGRILEWPPQLRPTGDKHSTGGVGDKVSLVLAPLLAAAGVTVPMISGRGLGPTGGTLDKLESIPGYRTDLSLHEFQQNAGTTGCVISGATAELAPADKRLYALRDVTGTVPSIPLITASILSKKLAAGLNGLVLDVKCGCGAFMKSLPEARHLAASLVRVGSQTGLPIGAIISDMSQPLGRMVGNSVEVDEAIDALRGEGPHDLVELTVALGSQLLCLLQLVPSPQQGVDQLHAILASGSAMEKWEQMVRIQGGDLTAPRPRAPERTVLADADGVVCHIHTEQIGQTIIDLGGGRRIQADQIDHGVGVEMLVRLGDQVTVGQPIARLFARSASAELGEQSLRSAIVIGPSCLKIPPLIYGRL